MRCPICKKQTTPKDRPFCSKHCADVDLGRWFNGTYAVAADTAEDMSDAASALEKLPHGPH
ncbi:MAG: DNA gyrase inhibitor YacG [Marinosulfonomonas sp.]|nr:DNA gyrase inhibitor YacG [Marinosulfonomonas sp.]PHQ99479.1 MAG: DNA gyrase inhibitor YacG [Marinosulfonomonas sp.]